MPMSEQSMLHIAGFIVQTSVLSKMEKITPAGVDARLAAASSALRENKDVGLLALKSSAELIADARWWNEHLEKAARG